MAVDALGILALTLAALLGVLLAALQLPGTWLILAAAIVYDWCYDWAKLGLVVLSVLAGLAVLGEVVEFAASYVFAGKAGGSRRAAWGGVIGGLVGMFVFTLPVPVLGTIAGGIIGCFVGAIVGEMTRHDDLQRSARVGIGAALGHIAGMIAKLALAFVIAGVAVSLAIFR
ncbi:MAG: DUF456 domain-containing protein [Phycisphaerales bacterium]|nr:MAG: DUF456 domain-containing protein [Phycisphaerales bacterium]